MKNLRLKARIVEQFGRQWSFARTAGTTPSMVSRVINGERILSTDEKHRWAEILKTRVEEIFHG